MHSERNPNPQKKPQQQQQPPQQHQPAPQAHHTAPLQHPGMAPPQQSESPPFCAHYALPHAQAGDVVRVEIDTDANILLLTDDGLAAYRRHAPFHYIGGGYAKGKHALGVPASGSWHVIVDLSGRPGHVTHHLETTHHEPHPPG